MYVDIAQFMRPDLVFLDVESKNKFDIFKAIVDHMAEMEVIDHPQAFLDELIDRETQAPTCIGRGIALPHTRTIFVDRPIIAFARTTRAISFGKQPDDDVELIFLMGTPKQEHNTYLRILGNLSRLLRKAEVREMLKSAESPAEVLQIVSEQKN